MVEIGQQVVSQVGEQDEAFLSQETLLSPGSQAQTTFVIAELLHLSASTAIVTGHKMAFGGQRQSGDVVAVAKLVFLKPALDENAHRAAIVTRWLDFTEPDVVIGIPATDLPGQGTGTPVGHTFGDEMVAASQEPTDVLVTSCAAIQTPNGPFSLGW
jgi:hypothetical protein